MYSYFYFNFSNKSEYESFHQLIYLICWQFYLSYMLLAILIADYLLIVVAVQCTV